MKVNNKLFFLMSSFIILSSSLCAKVYVTFENKTAQDQDLAVFAGGTSPESRIDFFRLGAGGKQGIWAPQNKGFSQVIWKTPLREDVINRHPNPRYTQAYAAEIVSSPKLTSGLVVIGQNGTCSANFTVHSQFSSERLHQVPSQKINP